MTPQERDLLSRFLDDLARSNPGPKDREAADQIERALMSNPDAAYVLVQHAILSDQALHAAQDRIAELERAGAAPAAEPSFLGAAFGKAPSNPASAPLGGATSVPPTPAPAQGGGFFGSPSAQASYGQPWGGDRPGPFSGGGGVGSFLRSAGTTAAGVAGGAFLFEGLSNIFGGHHGGGFGGGQGFMGGPTENVTINEYGDRDADRSSFADTGGDVNYDSDNGDISGDDYS